MAPEIDLKELERKAFTSFYQDGLWEIMLGFVLLQMGSSRLLTHYGFSDAWGVLVPIAGLVLLFAGKRFITVPRIGRVKFGPKRKGDLGKAVAVLSISVLAGVGLYIALSMGPGWQIGQIIPLIFFPLNAIIVFSLIAYFLDFSRLYAYGALIALALFIGELLDKLTGYYFAPSIVFGASAGVMFLIGLVVFIRFLRRYPLQLSEPPKSKKATEEDSHV